MKLRYALACVLVIVLLLFSGAVANFAQETTPREQPPHPRFGMLPPPAATCTDGKHLYVVWGPKILQYTIPDLKLHNTVELPKPDFLKDALQ
jgi:hypothetical protein